jgi:pimeloyl-ACP methyl ester carboxylesterase
VVVIGHGAGALQAAELAGREPAVAGAILLTATATAKTGEETLRWQAREIGDNIVPGPIKAILAWLPERREALDVS